MFNWFRKKTPEPGDDLDTKRALEFFARVNNLNGSLLKFDSVTSAIDGSVDQLLREIQRAVMVDADFRNHIAQLSITNEFVSYLNDFI